MGGGGVWACRWRELRPMSFGGGGGGEGGGERGGDREREGGKEEGRGRGRDGRGWYEMVGMK